MHTRHPSLFLGVAFTTLLVCAPAVYGQSTQDEQSSNLPAATASAQTHGVPAGEKMKIHGTISDWEGDTFTVRDANGGFTTVLFTNETSVKTHGGFLHTGRTYDRSALLRSLAVEVEGRGNSAGQLEAKKIRFHKEALTTARQIDTRAVPGENRLTTVEGQARVLEGQVGELEESAKVMRTDIDRNSQDIAKNSQAIAATDQRVTTTNERITAIDEYEVAQQATVLFKPNSAALTAEAKTALDQLAQQALATKGYIIEVAGYTDSTGSVAKNRTLSQRRADVVVAYLKDNHMIPLRRLIAPFGYGEATPAADNATREGREQNRRVDVKILINKGLVMPN